MAQTWSGVKSCPVDNVTESCITMDNDHNYIHQSNYYSGFKLVTITAGGTYTIGFTNGTKKVIHYRPAKVSTDGPRITIDLVKAIVFNGGTAISTFNHNMASTAAATMTAWGAPTVTAAGTVVSSDVIFGSTGVGGTRVGGETSGSINEWLIAKGAQAGKVITNGGTASATVNINFQWYEEDGPL